MKNDHPILLDDMVRTWIARHNAFHAAGMKEAADAIALCIHDLHLALDTISRNRESNKNSITNGDKQ